MDLFEITTFGYNGELIERQSADEDDVVAQLQACRELHWTTDPHTVVTDSAGRLVWIARV